MKQFILSILFSVLATIATVAQQPHAIWTRLLQGHVAADGIVSYQGFLNDSTELNDYLAWLSSNRPVAESSDEEKLAYWINAYNAFTVKLIVDHYPVQSIKDIKKGVPFVSSVWDIKFFEVGGEKMSLNMIEHSILRKEFNEPRIHFAIVCASKSCPKLRTEAYAAEKLEQQLTEQAVDFINDESKNYLEEEEIRVSPIFKWFQKDFTHEMSLKAYIRQYAKHDFGLYAKVKFMDYDWSLNGE